MCMMAAVTCLALIRLSGGVGAAWRPAILCAPERRADRADTLHRFCKKEHDWGWKKFMELHKISEGFITGGRLVVKAQVQVIQDTPARPFRCLAAPYRRELARVYLANVEAICRRFIEEKRSQLWTAIDSTAPGGASGRTLSFQSFWAALPRGQRVSLLQEKESIILASLVRRFFNEKEVTSSLVMDALCAGCRALERASAASAANGAAEAASNRHGSAASGAPGGAGQVIVMDAEAGCFRLAGDALHLWSCAARDGARPDASDDPFAVRLTHLSFCAGGARA